MKTDTAKLENLLTQKTGTEFYTRVYEGHVGMEKQHTLGIAIAKAHNFDDIEGFAVRSILENRGWGNGYVTIPTGHPLSGVSYKILTEAMDITVHGGITFSGYSRNLRNLEHLEGEDTYGAWVFGFDTAHFGDTRLLDRDFVIEEAKRLRDQLERISDVKLIITLREA